MNTYKRGLFLKEFAEMIDSMVDYEHFSRERLVDNLCRMARSFRLTKVVTEFYKSITDEKDGKGEVLCDFDEGPAEVVVMKKEIITKIGAIVRITAYSLKDMEDLDEEEERYLAIVLRSLMSYVGRNRLQTAVEILAYHDGNGYPNFAYYFRHLEKMNRQGGLYGYTAIMYNLKQFSLINRDIGLEHGDVVMRAHFETVKALVADRGAVCRVGGDNFAAIFPTELLESVISFLENASIGYDPQISSTVEVSAYVGVFVIPKEFRFERPGNIVEMIMPACQAAKASDKGDVYYASLKNLEMKENVSRVRRHFEEALEKGEFKAYYQPKVNVETGKIIGAEALCRWIWDGKTIQPMEFIPILERNTDICRLDFYMLDLACKDIRRWLDEGKNAVRVSVNFSRKHLVNPKLLDDIIIVLQRNNVPYEYIEIELTETTYEGDYQKLKNLVEDFRKNGIHTSIDDFGVGYSSLNIIRELPWNVMKIDRSLLPMSHAEKYNPATVVYKHITAMASEMGIECLTEGVETVEQLNILRENSCMYAQGYYFDKPLPLDEFEKRMEIGLYSVKDEE
ncbi:EAL domain-containing protein [Eubacterium xylanophilum]|uniref:EAL domain-containing protein n=1 Tax=Eubacterium xylanophilum TaxID=39497 RepID=UPI0004BBB6ED|nr:bifunctional diguanylate cyclase/phosphodiesterase [Eubacterium xylanophilum]